MRQSQTAAERERHDSLSLRFKLETDLAVMSMRNEELARLLQEIQNAKEGISITDKRVEWHTKNVDMRANELRLSRELAWARDRDTYMQTVITAHENSIRELERENARITRETEAQWLLWDDRETGMQR